MRCIFCILFTLISLFTYSQHEIVIGNSDYTYQSDKEINWITCEHTPSYTGGSFYMTIYTKGTKDDGLYYYDIYFYTNSKLKGMVVSSYIKNIKVYAWYNNEWVLVHKEDYYLVSPSEAHHFAYVYSYSWVNKIKITWEKVLPY